MLEPSDGRSWKRLLLIIDKVATILASIVAAPLLVVGQALEGTANGIQSISNLSAKKQLEYVQYCLAILKYLESENALVE